MNFLVRTAALAVAGGAAMLGVLADSGPAHSQDKKPVNVSWSAGQIGKTLKEVFADSYAEKDSLRIVESADNPRFTQMQANRGNPNTDLATFIDVLLPLVIKSGVIQKLDENKVPNLREVDPSLRSWDSYAVPYSYGTWGIVYNADKIKIPITSWADLLRDDVKGYVTTPNISFNSSIYVIDAMARLKGGSLENPDAGLQMIRQIRLSGPGLWDQESVAIGWLKTGEALVSTFYSGSALRLMNEPDTKHLRFVVPKEGAYIVPSNFVRVAGSANPDGADAFLNHIFSREAQKRWAEIGRTRPANKHVEVSAEIAAAVPTADKLNRIDSNYFVANRTSIVQKWNEIVNR